MRATRTAPTLMSVFAGDIFEKAFKVCEGLAGGQFRGFFLGNEIQIVVAPKQSPVAAEEFAHQALDSVSGDSTADFFGHRHPQP